MNIQAVTAIYKFEMARAWRTVAQSIISPVISTSLYFVVLFAIWSAIDYFKTFWTQIDSRFKERERRRLLLKKRQRTHVPTRHVPTQ